jgi:hypothetical protein
VNANRGSELLSMSGTRTRLAECMCSGTSSQSAREKGPSARSRAPGTHPGMACQSGDTCSSWVSSGRWTWWHGCSVVFLRLLSATGGRAEMCVPCFALDQKNYEHQWLPGVFTSASVLHASSCLELNCMSPRLCVD